MPPKPTGEALPHESQPNGTLNASAFWEKWGEQSGFAREEFDLMWAEAKATYTTLPYHNWRHAKETLWAGMQLVDDKIAEGITVDRKVLVGALLFHDAAFDKDPTTAGYATKEEHSAAIFAQNAEKYGYSPDQTKHGAHLIEFTAGNSEIETHEEEIMLKADLENVGGKNFLRFLQKNALLFVESQQLAESTIKAGVFAENSIKILSRYILILAKRGESVWLDQARANLDRLTNESAIRAGVQLSDYIRGLGSSAVNQLMGIRSSK